MNVVLEEITSSLYPQEAAEKKRGGMERLFLNSTMVALTFHITNQTACNLKPQSVQELGSFTFVIRPCDSN